MESELKNQEKVEVQKQELVKYTEVSIFSFLSVLPFIIVERAW